MRKPQLTISAQLLIIVGILNVLITLMVANRVYNAWISYKQAQQLIHTSAIIDDLYSANKHLSLERASSLAILYVASDEDNVLRNDLIQIRRDTDQSLNSALLQLNKEFYNKADETIQIRQQYQTLLEQREAIDKTLTLSLSERDLDIANQFFQSSSSLISSIQDFILVYSGRYHNIDPIINQHMTLKNFVWELAENTGKECAVIGQMIAENKAPTREQRKQLSSLNGHIEHTWEMLRKLPNNNELARKLNTFIEEANIQYFFIFEQINDLLDANYSEGTTVYPLSTEMWLGLSTQVVDSLLMLQDEILKETQTHAEEMEFNAKRRIAISLLIFICALMLSFYCWHIIVFRVTKPINVMINTLYKASHHQDIENLELYTPDEIGKLSRVLKAFQNNTNRIQQSNEELERFAFIAAHDLKTPLRAVDTISEWLEDDLSECLPEKSKQHFTELRGRIRLMDKLLDDTLEYARIDAKMKNKPEQIISGKDLITEIKALVNPPPGFKISTNESLEKVKFSKFPLQQVLYNLVQNAVTHHDKVQGNIDIGFDENEGFYIFYIRDDGPGIDARYHQKIFEMFQTLKPREKNKGRGMGLAIVRKIIATYGGTINLQSEPGQGSNFYFTWPKKPNSDTTGEHHPDSRREYA